MGGPVIGDKRRVETGEVGSLVRDYPGAVVCAVGDAQLEIENAAIGVCGFESGIPLAGAVILRPAMNSESRSDQEDCREVSRKLAQKHGAPLPRVKTIQIEKCSMEYRFSEPSGRSGKPAGVSDTIKAPG